eukprot:gene3398-13438_t
MSSGPQGGQAKPVGEGAYNRKSTRGAVQLDDSEVPPDQLSLAAAGPSRPSGGLKRGRLDAVPKGGKGSANERLEKAVLGGLMWCKECQALEPDMTSRLPLCFDSSDHYVAAFEPLLHEEARESVRSSWQEAADAGRGWKVEVHKVVDKGNGWTSAQLRPQHPRGHKEVLRDGAVIVLQCSVRNRRDQFNSGSFGSGHDDVVRLMCIVRGHGMWQPTDPMSVEFYPSCSQHAGFCLPTEHQGLGENPYLPECMAALDALIKYPSGWEAVECATLSQVHNMAMLPMLLHPTRESTVANGQLSRLWPADMSMPEHARFFAWLKSNYDMPQLEAIEIAASHLAPKSQQQASPQSPVLPITLIQ